MASRTVNVGKSIASLMENQVYDWPAQIVPTTPDSLFNAGIECKFFVVPNIDRVDTENVRLYVAPIPEQYLVDPTRRDRCKREYTQTYEAGLLKRLSIEDADLEQPATLSEIDELTEFVEKMADFWDDNKSATGLEFTVQNIGPELYNSDWLNSRRVFWGLVRLTVRHNA